MKTTLLKTHLIYFVICLIVLGCQEKQPEITYKFADKESFIECTTVNAKLFQEAFYNFEANLQDNYANKNPNLTFAYREYIKAYMTKNVNFNNMSTEQSINVFEALKQVDGLFTQSDNALKFNYSHPIFQCIADNIKDKDLKTTFNALLSTNSLSMRMLQDALLTNSPKVSSDKYLATYVALETYYTQLSNVDLSKKEDLETSTQKAKDPHAGHNH